MGMVASTMLKPNAAPPAWAIVLMIAFQVLGMVAMAVVFFDSMGLFISQARNSHLGSSPYRASVAAILVVRMFAIV